MTSKPCYSTPSTSETRHSIDSLQVITNSIQREVDVEPIQILDDISAFNEESEHTDKNETPDKTARKIEAASMTWAVISNYVQHYYLEAWVPRLSKYLNKLTRIGDEIWDMQQPDGNY